MNKSETNEGGEDSNNKEEVLVVVVSKMKVAQKLVGRRRRTHKFIFLEECNTSPFRALSRDEHLFLFTRVYVSC